MEPWKVRMWSIHETGVMEVQLVQIWMVWSWSVMVRLGLHQPIWLAQRGSAGCVPPLSESRQLELRSPIRMV